MMIRPTLEEARALLSKKNDCRVVPVMMELLADVRTPISALRSLREGSDRWFILESASGHDQRGRYSFLGYKPVLELYGSAADKDALQEIRETLRAYKSVKLADAPPFTGGLVGYFSYDILEQFMPGIVLKGRRDLGLRDYHLMLMDKIVVFDHFKQKMYIIVNVTADNLEESYRVGVSELEEIRRIIMGAEAEDEPVSVGDFSSLFSEEEFCAVVRSVKERIVAGDIFQAVVSNRFSAPFKGSLLSPFRVLRTTNPSPYMVCMHLGDIEIACSSPETLVSLRDGEVFSFPLAGTCKRGKTPQEDSLLREALIKDEKELAEHDMLVDLARNDLGKISRFGSVYVREYRQIKAFSHVSHIASSVSGDLREGLDALDVISATLPAGTLSGAPKKRACEIIDELEGVRRGVYGGAIGYIDFTGNMDMCIGIRMALRKGERVYVQAGAGVVADSDPQREYQETRNKAQAVIEALTFSQEL